jgi:3-hydroxy-9,10-secoandrosta-1,3,5(10)-triene-9,17-dione monooxygenase
MGNVAKSDPFQLAALARAESDYEASVCHFETVINRLFDQVSNGEPITADQRIAARRDMVRGVDRVITSIDELYRLAGASAIHTDTGRPLERFWRDLHAGGSHVCNVREPVYTAWGLRQFGGDIPLGTLY